uniref:Fibrinogen C-terminal domain-containing protein n=1 Tax=Plectus sambesii TaxID=2011161 RepID=A0A914X6K3_9BILA
MERKVKNVSRVAANNPAIGSLDQVWIGAKGINQDQTFVWADGTPFAYTNWLPGQPDRSKPCVSAQIRSSGKWSTDTCETQHYFICKYTMKPTATPTDCYDWYFNNGNSSTGTYRIYPPGVEPFDVRCDMATNGGGWTTFQRRLDNSTAFWNRPWADYKNGFNNGFSQNYWLGLDRIHALTAKDSNVTLHIDLFGNRCTQVIGPYYCDQQSGSDVHFDGEWASFSVENEANKYRLHVSPVLAGTISGSSFDPLYTESNNRYFTTIDVNNQPEMTEINCAAYQEWGAWWHDHCSIFMLNGKYDATRGIGGHGFSMNRMAHITDIPSWVNPIKSEMKLRRSN